MAKKSPEITKELLTNSALNILSSTSYRAARLEDIAREVGLTRGAIYWHFANKLDLYRHILLESFNVSMKDLYAVLDSDRDVLEKLEFVVDYLLGDKNEIHSKSALIYNSLLMERPEGLESIIADVEAWFETLFKKHGAILQQGMDTGIFKQELNPDFLARTHYNFLWGYFTNRERFFTSYPSDAIKDFVKSNFIESLRI